MEPTAKKEKVKYYFDGYQLSELYTLYDLHQEDDRKKFESWTLWCFIKKCFPKLDLENNLFVISFDSIFCPYIYDTGAK